VQWLSSEKQKKVVTPTLFWFFSLLASFLLFIYGYLRQDFAIMLGQSLTYFIYIRNLHLQGQWKKFPLPIRVFLLFVPVLIVFYYYNNNIIDTELLFKNENIPFWLLVLGVVAQIIFTFRFIYQWLYSERKKESSLPLGFWLLSLVGASLILTYAVFRKDPVLLAGHGFGLIIYIRNLMLLKKEHA
jgi:lipid-A-disaccharide synthase-like uncharacterized protein